MYVKFSFLQETVVIPSVWGGTIVILTQKPIIVSALPKNVVADKCILDKEMRYDYYYSCGRIKLQKITEALNRFNGPLFSTELVNSQFYLEMQPNAKNILFAENGKCCLTASDHEAFIKHFKLALKQCQHPHFSKALSFFNQQSSDTQKWDQQSEKKQKFTME